MAIEEVWLKYYNRYDHNFRKALKKYKGTVNNYASYNRTLALYSRLKDIK